jgi:heme exporter protein A
MLSCDKITCRRGGKVLFSGLDFSLAPGELAIIRGANGSGKTTLLKTLAGLYSPESGSITWDGADIRTRPEAYLWARCYIGHKSGVKPLLTVAEDLSFHAVMYAAEELLPSTLRYFGLEEYKSRSIGSLSYGWQRKVALSRLILSEGLVWLLDEPWNGLDEAGANLLTSLIKARLDNGGMVCIAAHGETPLKTKKEVVLGMEQVA